MKNNTLPLISVSHLLERTHQANKYQREIELATGENFNLFKILNIRHYEVRTHSPLLGDLLNPKGSHGLGTKFLALFLELLKQHAQTQVDPSFFARFNVETARVTLEECLGSKTETTGGRIDILIASGKIRIGIENKIYAREQQGQMQRYQNELEHDGILIYLTLDGSEPTSLDEQQKGKVLCISYANDILNWLKLCRKEASTTPLVRENLTQYIHLIQHLTHQNTSNRMNEDITKSVLSSEDNLRAFFALRNAEQAIKGAIVTKLFDRLKHLIPKDFNVVDWPEGNGAKGENFTFSTPALEALNLAAAIEFEGADYSKCFIGFWRTTPPTPDDANELIVQRLKDAFSKHPQFQKRTESTPHWPMWQWFNPENWDDEVLLSLQFHPDDFDRNMLANINGLFEVAKTLEETNSGNS